MTEYLIHRLLMHRPLWPRTLYRNHTLGHHRAFHHDSMEIASWRELDLVMMPWFSLLLFFAGMAPLVAAGRRRALGRGAAGLLLLTAVISFVIVRRDARAVSPSAGRFCDGCACWTAASFASSTTTTGIITG